MNCYNFCIAILIVFEHHQTE